MHKSILMAVLLLGACGGDDDGGSTSSGVTTTKQLKDLTAAEQMQECEWGIAYQGGPGHQTMCGDGVTVTVDTVAECLQTMMEFVSGGCTVTVEQLETCTRAVAADPCALGGDACGPVLTCLQ